MGQRRKRARNESTGGVPRQTAAAGAAPARWRWFWWGTIAAALLLRFALLPVATKYGYLLDHDDFARWGIQAADKGLLTLYTEPPPRQGLRQWHNGAWETRARTFDRVCNYPPGATYLLWVSGELHKACSADRILNTTLARGLFSLWSILADVLLAWGCAALVGLLRPGAAPRWTFALTLLLPPLWWDSVMWGQWDSVVLAPAVWMLYYMVRQRWLPAGVLWGVALALKPQAVLLTPVWAFVVLRQLLNRQAFWRPLAGGVAAVAVVVVLAIPHMRVSGGAWFDKSYHENLFATYSNYTTLSAFNVWYIDALVSENLDATQTWGPATKAVWGRNVLLAGLGLLFAFALWRWRKDRRGPVLVAAGTLLLAVMLPTKVHERYLLLALPFLGVLGAWAYRFLPGLALLILVLMAQITWPLWLSPKAGLWAGHELQIRRAYEQQAARLPPAQVPPFEDVVAPYRAKYNADRAPIAPREWFYTCAALLGTLLTLFGFATLRPRDDLPTAAPPPETP